MSALLFRVHVILLNSIVGLTSVLCPLISSVLLLAPIVLSLRCILISSKFPPFISDAAARPISTAWSQLTDGAATMPVDTGDKAICFVASRCIYLYCLLTWYFAGVLYAALRYHCVFRWIVPVHHRWKHILAARGPTLPMYFLLSHVHESFLTWGILVTKWEMQECPCASYFTKCIKLSKALSSCWLPKVTPSKTS